MRGNTEKRKPSPVAATRQAFRYRQLAGEIEKKILEGTYQAGEKLPSIRRLHQQTNLSISTVYQAYVELENTGFVEARPKSGYYVRPVSFKKLEAPALRKKTSAPRRVNLAPVINSVIAAISNPRFVPFGNTAMDPALLPVKTFTRILKSLSRNEMRTLLSYSPSEGFPELRRQLALRTLGVLEGIEPEDIIITNGCMEALALSLLAVTRPGDTVAIEAPTNFSFLQLLRELGLLVLEIATDPQEGVDLEELEKSLRTNTIRACLFMPNFQNPLGALMSEDKKRALVKLVTSHGDPHNRGRHQQPALFRRAAPGTAQGLRPRRSHSDLLVILKNPGARAAPWMGYPGQTAQLQDSASEGRHHDLHLHPGPIRGLAFPGQRRLRATSAGTSKRIEKAAVQDRHRDSTSFSGKDPAGRSPGGLTALG